MAESIYEWSKRNTGNPFMAYRFIVEVSGVTMASFSQFSGIKTQVQTIQARAGDDARGVQEYVPVITSYAPATLTKGVVFGPDFLEWLAASSAGKFSGPSGHPLHRTIDVIALDDRGNRGVIWTLYNAMPIAYELAPMDAGRSEVLAESVTFAYTAMEREYRTSIPLPDIFNPAKKPHSAVTKKDAAPAPKPSHKQITRVTPTPVTTTETAAPVPGSKHGKVTKVTPVPVPKNTHKK